MGNKLTLFTPDGQWKADLHAWKNYAFVYKSIGSEATVYHRESTKNVWGNTVTDWVRRTAFISITNVYHGSIPQTFTQNASVNDSYAELKLWAVGIIVVTINTDTGGVDGRPGGATLDVDSVVAQISVSIPGQNSLSGSVSADNIITQNSLW